MTGLPGKPIVLDRTAEFLAWKAVRWLNFFFDWFDMESIRFEQWFSIPSVGKIV